MNDDELITIVREQRNTVRMTIPVEQIVRRGREVRTRRRLPRTAGVLAAAGTALAVTALIPASHHPAQPAPAQLAAWTVTRQADGTISVSIRELRDPAGLQRTLRAEGLPVTVSFSGPPLSASCHPYLASKALLISIRQLHPGDHAATLVIHPSALPPGAGLAIFDRPTLPPPPQSKPLTALGFALSAGLVHASQECTGS